MGGLMNSQTQNANQNTAQNTATNANSATNYGSNTAATNATNTANTTNTAFANGPSQAAATLIGQATNPSNTIGNLNAFFNPYTKQVADATMANLGQLFGQQQSELTGNAIAQNALGGDRAKLAQAALMGQQGLAAGSTLSNLYNTGYNTALNAALQTAGQQLQGAGISGTQGSTGTQQIGSTQGAQASQTLGGLNTAQSSASANAGQSSGSTTTSTNPGIATIGGLGLGLLGVKDGGGIRLADGGHATLGDLFLRKYDDGGAVDPNAGQYIWVPANSQPNIGTLAMAQGNNAASPNAMYQLGQKAHDFLSENLFGKPSNSSTSQANAGQNYNPNSPQGMYNLGHGFNTALFGTSSQPTTGDGGWQTNTQTSGLVGSGGLKNTIGNLAEGIGSAMGFAKGGDTSAAPVSTGIASLPSTAFYTPASFTPVQAASPMVSAPVASIPSIPAASVAQAQMPWVPFPNVPQASSGKGSGGAVRGFADGGDTSDNPAWAYDPQVLAEPPAQFTATPAPAEQPPSRSIGNLIIPSANAAEVTPAVAPAPPVSEPNLGNINAAPATLANLPASPDARNAQATASLAMLPNPANPVAAPLAAPNIGTAPIISGRLETGTSDPLKGIGTIAHDSAGSHSYGNFGLNSLPGSSAWHFKRDYGEALGLTADPGTPAFDAQWRNVAANNPQALRQAELDWYNKNIGANVTGSLENVGVPREIASDPRVQSYFGDRMIQQGAYSTVNHANRIRGAYESSGGDPVKFLQTVSALDKDPSNLSRDFRTALSTGVYSERANNNRVDGRLSAALGGGSVPATSSTDAGHSTIGDLFHRASSIFGSGVGAKDQPTSQEGTGLGGLLGLSRGTQDTLSKMGRILASTGEGHLAQGLQFEPELGIRQQQQGNEQQRINFEAQRLAKELATPHQIGSTQTQYVDQFGVPHVNVIPQYGVYDPNSKGFVPTKAGLNETPASGAPNGVQTGYGALPNIPAEIQGDDFISEARKSGIPANDLDIANKVANYKVDPNKLLALKQMERRRIVQLASRINPDYDMMKYPAVADTDKKLASGDVAKSLRSVGRLFDEVEQAASLAGNTGNWQSENFNAATSHLYPSGSNYGIAMGKLGTALNNVADTAAAVAKGGGQGAEGDAKRRSENMNKYQAPEALKGALYTEAEIALKNGQSNLTSYNVAHGYTPENPNYKSIMDYLTPAQQERAVTMLGAKKIEEITGKPVPQNLGKRAASSESTAVPPRPANVPSGAFYSPSTGKWYDPVTHKAID